MYSLTEKQIHGTQKKYTQECFCSKYNNYKLEVTQMTINGKMYKLWHIHSRDYTALKIKYAQQNNVGQKEYRHKINTEFFHLFKIQKQVKLIYSYWKSGKWLPLGRKQ